MKTIQQYVKLGHSRKNAAERVASDISDAVRYRSILWAALEAAKNADSYHIEVFAISHGDDEPATPELRGPGTRASEAAIVPAAWCPDGDIPKALERWRAEISVRRESLLSDLVALLD
jgi:hypothetical protein